MKKSATDKLCYTIVVIGFIYTIFILGASFGPHIWPLACPSCGHTISKPVASINM